MNILYISTKRGWAGVVSWMVKTAQGLEERGHKVFIVTHPESALLHHSPTGVRLIPLKPGCDYNPLTIWFLCRLIKKHDIGIVVANIQKEISLAGPAARICGIPCIRRIGSELDLNHRFKVRFNQRLFVDHNIIPARAVFEQAARRLRSLREEDFTVVYNGRNPVRIPADDIADIRESWGIGKDEIVIGVTSQLSVIKSIDAVIRVFDELHRTYPNIKLVITGRGNQLPVLQLMVSNMKLRDHVLFPGFTNHPVETAAAYDICVSNSRKEGFPNTVVEYMAAGRPVVATDTDGVPEILQDGVQGFLISIDDEEGLHDSLEGLLKDSELRRRMGEAAQKRVDESFSETEMVKNVEHVLMKFYRKS